MFWRLPEPELAVAEPVLADLLACRAKPSTFINRAKLGRAKPMEIVTGEGQKTSSVLIRALSRIEMKIQAETIRLSDRSWSKAQVLLSVETEETQLGSLGDQVSSYLYYTRYAEHPTTDATWNTPIV